jgi:hypothetical protein
MAGFGEVNKPGSLWSSKPWPRERVGDEKHPSSLTFSGTKFTTFAFGDKMESYFVSFSKRFSLGRGNGELVQSSLSLPGFADHTCCCAA